jgi:hypothetical protein
MTEVRVFVAAHARAAKSWRGDIIIGGECRWEEEYVMETNKFSHLSGGRQKINQNDDKDS